MPTSAVTALDGDAIRLWTRAVDVRTVLLCLTVALSPFMPAFGEDRLRNSLWLAVVILPYAALLSLRIRRTHRVEGFLPIADVVLVAAFGAMVPETWPAVIGVAVADVAFAVVLFGRRFALITTAVGARHRATTGRPLAGGQR